MEGCGCGDVSPPDGSAVVFPLARYMLYLHVGWRCSLTALMRVVMMAVVGSEPTCQTQTAVDCRRHDVRG